jgi:hypothetical protein
LNEARAREHAICSTRLRRITVEARMETSAVKRRKFRSVPVLMRRFVSA